MCQSVRLKIAIATTLDGQKDEKIGQKFSNPEILTFV